MSAAALTDAGTWLARGAASSDPHLLERVVVESKVATTLPEPSLQDWVGEVVERGAEALGDGLARALQAVDVPAGAVRFFAFALTAAVVALLAVLVWRRLRRHRVGAPQVVQEPQRRAEVTQADAALWRAEVSRRLAAGDARSALEALWWWVGWLGLGRAPEPSCTSRELARRSARGELAPLLAAVDTLAFAPAAPRVSDVRSLLDRLEEAER